MKKITEEEFLDVYESHPANGFTKWAYHNYSTDLKAKPTPVGSWLAIFGFVVGTVGMIVFDQLGNKDVARMFCSLYLLFFLWVVSLPAWIMNKVRINKIVKELGISPEEYNVLVSMYNPKD